MSLYEGLDDLKVIVVDLGAAYTKCGLAGETGPRCIIPSKVKNSRSQQIINIWDYSSKSELYENIRDHLYTLLFKHLLITPKDRRVVVVESLLCPSDFRETLAQVLFKHFEVGSVYFATSHLVSLLTLHRNTGLVVDVGYNETLVVPVYEGIPIMKGWMSAPLAGKAIHSRIKTQLLEYGTINTLEEEHLPVSSIPDCIDDSILEDIKVRCCFVTEYSRGQQIQEVTMRGGHANKLPQPPPDVDYPLDGNSLLHISGRIREHSCEVLFEQDVDEASVATLVLDSLVKCPIDTRLQLATNIVVTGGTAMLPGFHHRLQLELANLLLRPRYSQKLGVKECRYHQPPAKENYTAWLGGALMGAVDTLPWKSLTREAYIQKGKLPDWCCVDSEFIEEKSSIK